MEAIGLNVNRLIRVAYGPFQLGILEKGEAEEIKASVLRDQLGRWMTTHEEERPTRKPAPAKPAPTKPTPAKPTGSRPATGAASRHAPAPRRRPA